MIRNDVSFGGKIIFVNKESYQNSKQFRPYIHHLKYNCGGKDVSHFVQCDDTAFKIETAFEHPVKADGVSKHILSHCICGSYTEDNVFKVFFNHILDYKDWKMEIDQIPDLNPAIIVKNKKRLSFVNRILNYFKMKL